VERLQEFEKKAQDIISGNATEFELSRIPLLKSPKGYFSGAAL